MNSVPSVAKSEIRPGSCRGGEVTRHSDNLFTDQLIEEIVTGALDGGPDSGEVITRLERRRADARLSLRERQRQQRQQAKQARRKGRRVMYDLAPEIIRRVGEVADRHEVPHSQVAAALLLHALAALERGEIDLDALKQPTQSRRYSWNLALPGADEVIVETPRQRGGPKRS